MRYRDVATIGVALAVCGCAERNVLAPNARVAAETEFDVNDVARSFALGMADAGLRAAVRDAMRASRLTEHKLSLRQFVTTRTGGRLLKGAAEAVGIDVGELRATIARLPDLDFYVPARQHRLTWRATADYVVAVSLHGRAPTTAYDADGHTVPLDLSKAEAPTFALLMLQAAETKSRRVNPQANRPGLTIQDPDDGELSGTLTITNTRGTTNTFELANLAAQGGAISLSVEECDDPAAIEECDGGGGGGSSPPGNGETFLERIATNGICDNGNCFEGNEFEFRAATPSGQTEVLRIEGVGCCDWNDGEGVLVHRHLIYAVPPMWVGGENGNIAARETDSFNADDWFFFTDLGYCGAVQLDDDDNFAFWYLTESSCDVFDPKTLGVQYSWVFP